MRRALTCFGLAVSAYVPQAVPAAGQGDEIAGEGEPTSHPLDFLEPLIGTWVADPEWRAANPEAPDFVALILEWGPNRNAIHYRAGGLDASGAPYTTGVIAWNPGTQRAEFVSSQTLDGFLFEGYYEALDANTVRRTYTVHYADQRPLRFRETFYRLDSRTMDWLTEWAPRGEWVPRRGNGEPEFRTVRAYQSGAEALAAVRALDGEWRLGSPQRLWGGLPGGDAGAATVRFTWGADLSWVGFTEVSASDPDVLVGSGVLAFDPKLQVLSATAHYSSGLTLKGTAAMRPDEVEWHMRAYAPDGTVTQWRERWRPPARAGECVSREVLDAGEGRGDRAPNEMCPVP